MSDQSANVPSTTIEYLQRVLQELGLHATFQTLTEELSLLQQQQQQCRSARNSCSSNGPPPSDQNTLPYHTDVQSLRTLLLCPWETPHKTSFSSSSASPQLDGSPSQLGHEREVIAGALRGACQWIGAALASPLETPVEKKSAARSPHRLPQDECLTLLQFFFFYAKEATRRVETEVSKATTTEGHNKNQAAVKEEQQARWMDAALCEVSRWNATIAASAIATSSLSEQESEGPDHMRDANAFPLPGAVRFESSDPAKVGLASNVTEAAAIKIASSFDSSTDRLLRLLSQVLRHALTRSSSTSSVSSQPTSRSDETSNEEEGVTAPNTSAVKQIKSSDTTTTKRRATKAAAATIRAQLPSLTELHHATRSLLALTHQDGEGQQQSGLSGGLRGVVGAADGGGGSAGSTLEVRATIGCEVLLALEATIDQSIQRSFLATATESSSITKQGSSLPSSRGRQNTSSTAAIDSEATNIGLDAVNEEEERRRLLLFRQNRLLLEDVWRVLFRIALRASFSERANSSNATTTVPITAQRTEEHLLRCLVTQFTSKAMAVCSYYAKTTVSALSSAALGQDGHCDNSIVPRRPASSSAVYWHYWEEKYRRNENVEDRGDEDAGHHRHAAATIAADPNKTVGAPRPAQVLGKKRQRSSVALDEGSLRQSQRSSQPVETTKNESKRRLRVDVRRPAAAPMLLAACSPSVHRVAALLSSVGLNQEEQEEKKHKNPLTHSATSTTTTTSSSNASPRKERPPQQHRIEVLQVHYDETSSRLWLLTSEGQLISTSSGGGGGAQDKGDELTVHMTVPPSLFHHLPHSNEDRNNLNNNNKGPKQTGKRDQQQQQQEQLLPNSRSFSSCLSYLPLWGPSLIPQQQPNHHPSSCKKHDVAVGGIAAFFVEDDDDDGGSSSSGGGGVASRGPQTAVDRRRHSALLHLFVHHHHQRQQQQPTHCTMEEEQQQQVRHDGSQPQKSRCEGKARVSLVIRPPTSSLCHPRNWTIRSVNVTGDERANDVSSTANNNHNSAVVAVLTHRQACERENIWTRTTSHAEAEDETKEQSNVSFGNSTSSLCNGDDVSLRELRDLSSSPLRAAAATARHPRDAAALQSWPIVQCCALFPLPIASSSSCSPSSMNTKRSGATEDAEGDDARNNVAPNSQAVGLLVALSTNMVLQFRVELSFRVGTLEAPKTVVSLTKVFGGLAASVHNLVPVPWLNAFATLDGANRLLLYSAMPSSSNEEEAAECFMESAVAPSSSGSALRSTSPLTEILMTSRGPQWATSSDSFHRSAAGEQQNRPVADAARVAELAQHFLGPVGPRFVTKSCRSHSAEGPALPIGHTEHLTPSLLERVLWERDLHQEAEEMRHHGPQYQLSGSSNSSSRRTNEKLGPRCVCAPPTTRFNFTPLLQQSILQCRGLGVRDEVSHGGQQTAPPYHLLQLTSSATLRPPSPPSSSASSRLDRSFPVVGGRFLALTVAVEHTRAITYQMEHPSRLVPGFYAVVVIDLQNGSLRSITPVAALDDPLGILETRRWAHRSSSRHGAAAEQQQQHPKPILMLPLQFVWLGDPPSVDVASVSEKQNQRSATMLAPPPTLHKNETRSRHATSSRVGLPPVGEDNGNPQIADEARIGVAVGLTRRAIGLLDVTDGGSFRTFLLDGGMSTPLPLLDSPNQQESIAAGPTEKSSLLKPSASTSTSVPRLHGTWWWRSACCLYHSHPEKEGASFSSTSTVCRYAASDPYWHQVQCDAKKAEEEQKRLQEERCRTQRTQGGARWLASRASKDLLSSLFCCVTAAGDATQQTTGSGTIAREVEKTTSMKESEMDRLRESQHTVAARLFTVEEVQQKLRDERATHHHHRSSLDLTSNKKRAREDDEVAVGDDDDAGSRELEPSLRSSSYWRHVFDRLLLFQQQQQQQRNRKDEPQLEATPERAQDEVGRRSLPLTKEPAPASRSADALTTPSSSSLIQRSMLNPLNGRPNPQLPRHLSDEAAASQSGSGGGCVGGDEEHVRWRVGVANDFTFCWWRGPQSSSVVSSRLSAVPSVIIADDEGNVIVQPLHSSA